MVLTACPEGLRGSLTRWLLEISPGVFVGHANPRVRDALWDQTTANVKDGRALMVFSARNEQGLDFKVHRHDWEPVDLDGVQLIRRPSESDKTQRRLRQGWSTASHMRRRSRK